MLKHGNVSQSVGFGGAAATIALAASLLPVMPTFAQTATPPAAPGVQPAYVYEVAPDQALPADALPGTTAMPMIVTSSAAGPGIVTVRPAMPQAAFSTATAEYQQAVASADANQAWGKIQDGRQIELAKAQAEVAALQAQLQMATARLKELQMEMSRPGAMNGNFKFDGQTRFELRQLPDGKGGVVFMTPDKKIVARYDAGIAGAAPNPPTAQNWFQPQSGYRQGLVGTPQANDGQPMQPPQPTPSFGGAGMPAMPGDRAMGKFGATFGRAGAEYKADAAREQRMNRIESQLSELMKSVAELRQEMQPDRDQQPGNLRTR